MQKLWIYILLAIIILGHLAMWLSDMPRDQALRLTLINAAGWAIILLPAWAVSKWAEAHQRPKGPSSSSPICGKRSD